MSIINTPTMDLVSFKEQILAPFSEEERALLDELVDVYLRGTELLTCQELNPEEVKSADLNPETEINIPV